MPSVPCAFILQQYCNGGDLHNFVCASAKVTTTTHDLKDRLRRRSRGEAEMPRKPNEPKKLLFEEIYSFFRDITEGIRFLHLNGFIHRDLKPSNCLLHTVGGEMRVLVSDFGEVQYENALRKSTGATGTISYCAPEVLIRERPDGPFGNFTLKSDIFSLGMILHFLCFADLPYRYANVLHEEQEDVDKLRDEITAWSGFDDQRKLRPDLPARLYSFLKRLLSLRPDDRPTADEVNNGIRIGGLDQLPDMRRRSSHGPEELTPGRRVQKIDTPIRGQSPKRGSGLDLIPGGPKTQLRLRRPSQGPPNNDMSEDIPEHAIEDEETFGGGGGINMERSISAPVRSTNPSFSTPKSSPTIQSPRRSSPTSSSPERRPQLLLPPPPPQLHQSLISVVRDQTQLVLARQISSPTARITILGLKLLTMLQPCMSRGMNAAVLYPLLALALLELLVYPLQIWKAGGFLTVHVVTLWYAVHSDSLCNTSRRIPWRDET